MTTVTKILKYTLLSLVLPNTITSVQASSGLKWLTPLVHQFHLPEHVLSFFLVACIILILGMLYNNSLKSASNIIYPDSGLSLRNIVEAFGQFILNQCRSIIGEKHGADYFPFVAVIFITILLSNLIGMIPGFGAPTSEIDTTLALGLFFLYLLQLYRNKEIWFRVFKTFCWAFMVFGTSCFYH